MEGWKEEGGVMVIGIKGEGEMLKVVGDVLCKGENIHTWYYCTFSMLKENLILCANR